MIRAFDVIAPSVRRESGVSLVDYSSPEGATAAAYNGAADLAAAAILIVCDIAR